MKRNVILLNYPRYAREQRYLHRTIKKEMYDSNKYRKMFSKIQNELKYYKNYSMSAYYWNEDLMNQINNLTMSKND